MGRVAEVLRGRRPAGLAVSLLEVVIRDCRPTSPA